MAISYKLPPLQKTEKVEVGASLEDGEWMRRVRIPVSKEQVQALSIGDAETVTLKGKVVELESLEREGQEKGVNEMCVVIDEVEISAMNEFEKMAEED